MKNRLRILVLGTLILAPALGPIIRSEARADTPPLSGAVQNFEAHEVPQSTPQTPFQDDDSRERTLADFRGRVILVSFWATWCLGSRRELPTLERLQAKLGSDSFAVVLMSQDRDGWKAVNPFLDKFGINGPERYLDDGLDLARAIDLPPQMGSILIDEAGRELGRLTGQTNWDTPEAVALIEHYLESPSHSRTN